MKKETKTNFIGFYTNVTKENGTVGEVSVSITVNGMPLTDEELEALKSLEEETAEKADRILNK